MKRELPVRTVLSAFFSMTGETDAVSWLDFCRVSCQTILSGLRDDADIEENESILCYAAACHAFYIYVLRKCATEIGSFKAVDIAIDNQNELTIAAAKTMYDDALATVAHLMRSTDFAFRTV